MDLTPGQVEITEEMVNVYDDSARAARVVGVRMGLSGWALNRYVIVSALGGLRSHLEYKATEAAYQAGREDAARELLDDREPPLSILACGLDRYCPSKCGDTTGAQCFARRHNYRAQFMRHQGDQPRTLAHGVGDNPEEQQP